MTILHLIHKAIWYCVLFVPAVIGSLIAIIFSPLIAYFVDSEGHLPTYLKWFETTDATMFDELWVAEHPTWSKYFIALTWCARNPFYGFLAYVSCSAPSTTKTYGNDNIDDKRGVSGWFFILGNNGAFQFRFIYPIGLGKCIQGDYGWQLKTPAHKTYRMLQLAPFRFYKFGV